MNDSRPLVIGCLVVGLLAVVGCGGCGVAAIVVGPQVVEWVVGAGDVSPGPQPPPSDSSDRIHAAFVEYAHAQADAFEAEAKAPGATVRDSGERVRKQVEAARGKWREKLNEVMAPQVGDGDLDPVKAKACFEGVAKGLRSVR